MQYFLQYLIEKDYLKNITKNNFFHTIKMPSESVFSSAVSEDSVSTSVSSNVSSCSSGYIPSDENIGIFLFGMLFFHVANRAIVRKILEYKKIQQ